MNQNKGQPNSYVSEVLGGGIHVQWISENAFIIKIMHIQQIAKEDEEIIGQNQDSDDFIKDWEMRIGVEYHRLLDGQRRLYDCATPFVPMNWILKKQVYGWLIAIVVILSVLFSSSVVFTIIAVVYRTKKSRKDMRDEEAQSQVSDWH
ncbi:MAG: hypothetical protein EZS28_001022 [Streblomastix strix]|uniref:Uncharacterized protein n=1 Tax=Streblomastix strix TaxID=222440 RepID=A0A5J4X983_9EUKA|nr:MAG: hypothetical protein EZS28_001022 [Streblomastix strix]